MSKVITYLLIPTFVFIGWATMAQAYEVVEVQKGGTIHGTIAFSGTPPEPLQFEVEKNPEVCGKQRSLVKVETQNGLLKGAVVILEGIESGKPFAMQEFKGSDPGKGTFHYTGGETLGFHVNTENCNFGPYTGVLIADEAIQFSNHDSIKHTLQTFVSLNSEGSVLRTLHNRDIRPARSFHRTFETEKLRESRIVRITCNRHDFMQNWLYVVKNPYFSISDANGQFTIKDIPPGKYMMRAWHPILGLQERNVQVGPNGSFMTDFSFSS